jgi:branched-chain amino acid aminotransferase
MLMDEGQARIAPDDRGFLLGDGLFETLLVRAGQPIWLAEHLVRLAGGCLILSIPNPLNDQNVDERIAALLAANGLQTASVRITLTRGPGPRGLLPPATLKPTVLVTCAPYKPSANKAIPAIIAAYPINERSPLCGVKSLSRLDFVLARQAAAAGGAGEALLLNTAGRLVEASAANLFLVRGQTLLTPPLADGALPGITRAWLLANAAAWGLTAREQSLTPADLSPETGLLLTNSLVGIQPVLRVGNISLAQIAEIVHRLQAAFNALH